MGKAPKTLPPETLHSMKKILASLDEKYSVVDAPELGNLVNYSTKADEPIHRWFRYREGYSTSLVESLLQDIPPGKLIIDPFCGAGTTLLVAGQKGYPSIGLDVNPLSAFVSKTKARNYSLDFLDGIEKICKRIQRLHLDDKPASKPGLSIIDKIFLPEVLHTLLILKQFIETELPPYERDFLFLAWLSILEEVSNVYREGNGIKYRNRKRTPSGYIQIPMDVWQRSMFPEDKFEHVINVFLKHVQMMIEDIKSGYPITCEADVFEGDALSLDDFVQQDSASLVTFSPPYANNFNYFKAYKVELWMGGFVSDYNDMKQLTRGSLRSHVETELTRNSDHKNWYPEQLDSFIELIDIDTLWTPRILNAVKGYFYDMHRVIEKIFDTLEIGGRCVIVVGNSAYGSVLIPTDALLAETANSAGLEVERIAVARHLTTSSQQKQALNSVKSYLRESVIFLKKTKSSRQRPNGENGFVKYRYVSELPRFPNSSSVIYVIKNRGLTELTHIIHKYPGKFIPHIPRWAIDKYLDTASSKNILDPFCGSGTSLVEAQLCGHNAYGIDIDPIARLISKVKTTPINADKLRQAVQSIVDEVERTSKSHFRPQIDSLEHWFTQSASNDLGIIREKIEKWQSIDSDIYDFLVVCLSSIIRRVSNADNQSLKTYVSGTHSKVPPPVKPLFIKTLNEYAERVIQFTEIVPKNVKTEILQIDDARCFSTHWLHRELPLIDLGITSPPYIKTIDYIYNQMAEYFWIGDLFNLADRKKQNKAKKRYIGTEKVVVDEYREKQLIGLSKIDEFTERIYEHSAKHGYIFYRYFEDMKIHFQQMHKVLKPDGKYVIAIGDSSVSNIPIPTHDLLSEVARAEGFKIENQFAYEIRNRYMRFPRKGRGGIVDLDWIMTFSKQ
jgi:DNA modification methylase